MNTSPNQVISNNSGSTPRSFNVTPLEDRNLCRAWARTSDNAAVGTNRNGLAFFEDVEKNYVIVFTESEKPDESPVPMPVSRTAVQLRARWNKIQAAVMKFVGVLEDVLARNASGANHDDNYNEALRLYELEHPQHHRFQYGDCYEILKDEPKWTSYVAAKNNRGGRRTAIVSSTSASEESTLEEVPRPQGRKASKRKAAEGPSLATILEEQFEALNKQLEKRQKLNEKNKKFDRLLIRCAQDHELIMADISHLNDTPDMLAYAIENKQKARERMLSGVYSQLDEIFENGSEEEE
ncbi:unnamed protein product [Mucor hiemalis]